MEAPIDMEQRLARIEDGIATLIAFVGRQFRKYDAVEAAERLGISARTLYRRVDSGLLEACYEGGRVYFTEAQVQKCEQMMREKGRTRRMLALHEVQ